MMRYKYLFILLLSVVLSSCNEGQSPETTTTPQQEEAVVPREPGCKNCHTDITPDTHHSFSCTQCHHGDNTTAEKVKAHAGLIPKPASPEHMAESCGECHPEQIQGCQSSLHYSLKNAVNLTREHFGATEKLHSLTQIPVTEGNTETALVDDMLRRRCLRCHVYSSGDNYPYITRGQGCAACHLEFIDGSLQDHGFIQRPGDKQCLSCHYGNHVGADYHGQFEHDFNWEYRTPYITREEFFRPYGVELHNLTPDIHQQKGLRCIDCHPGSSLKAGAGSMHCSSCHDWKPGAAKPDQENIALSDNGLILTDSAGKQHRIPPMTHPAHAQYGGKVECQVCHAQWGFNDSTTHLLLSPLDEYDFMERLTVQSSSWVESLLEHNINSDEDEIDPVMKDGITGQTRAGVWYKGYSQRRWEELIIKSDTDGIIKVFRPILDLRVSAIDEDGAVLFDNLTGTGNGLLPYIPHTTGPAGLFFKNRFSHLLPKTQEIPSAQ